MSLLHSSMNDDVVFIRDGKKTAVQVYVSGRKIVAPFGIDVRHGDLVRWTGFSEDHAVTRVEPHQAPRGRGIGMEHTTIHVVPLHEYERSHRSTPVSQTWNIGSAGVVAGNDFSGPVTVNMAGTQFFSELIEKIEKDESIPPEEKAGILGKLRDIVLNPKVIEAAAAVIKTVVV